MTLPVQSGLDWHAEHSMLPLRDFGGSGGAHANEHIDIQSNGDPVPPGRAVTRAAELVLHKAPPRRCRAPLTFGTAMRDDPRQ